MMTSYSCDPTNARILLICIILINYYLLGKADGYDKKIKIIIYTFVTITTLFFFLLVYQGVKIGCM